MQSDDLTLRVLIEIRDEIRSTNERVDHTNSRLDHLRDDLGSRIDRLRDDLGERIDRVDHRITAVDLRHHTTQLELIASTNNVGTMLQNNFALRDRVAQCEQDIADLRDRIG